MKKLTYKQKRELLAQYPIYTDDNPSGLEPSKDLMVQ